MDVGAAPTEKQQPERTFGPYRLLERLGEGGAGIVYRAKNIQTGQIVALKTARVASEERLASVRREIHALGRIRHPGIAAILDGGVEGGQPWYAMELLEGATLSDHMLRDPSSRPKTTEETLSPMSGAPTSPGPGAGSARTAAAPAVVPGRPVVGASSSEEERVWFLKLVHGICEPLAFLHGEGFIHRDIKPSNIFVRSDGTPILMDFGLVWLLQEEGSREVLTVEAARGGTVTYMAPEQALGDRIDARADLFSLGCILYEGITGRRAFVAETRTDLIAAHARRPLWPSELAANVPPALDELVMGLLAPHPRDRIGHASDVAAMLADLGVQAPAAPNRSPAKAYLYRPELVGRGALLERTLEHVERLRGGRGGCVLVAGESGIGKTSFVSAVAQMVESRAVRVVTGECVAVGVADGRGLRQGGPLYPLARLLQTVADRCVSGGAALTAKMLGERAKILATSEPTLKQLPGVESYPDPAEVPGEAARRRLIDAMADTLAAFAAERPTLLIIDDLQWADDLTLALLTALSERYYAANAVLILGTCRSEESTPDLDRLAALPHVARVQLDRLDATTIGAMASDMLGQRNVPEKLSAFLTTESSGNPFFVSEYLRAAVDAGLLFRDERGRWQQSEGAIALDRLGLPRTLQALVSRRLDSLSDTSRALAQAASVLGREVEIDVLCALALAVGSAADEGEFEQILRNLVVRQVLETTAGSARFVHDKLREITYEGLAPERQVKLHGAAAALLERRHLEGGTLPSAYATLALHFEKAGVFAKAREYFDKAGEAAHAMHANQEALRLLARAKELDGQVPEPSAPIARSRRERLLGVNALAVGNVKGALSSLTEATRAAGIPWPRSRAHLAMRCMSAIGYELRMRWLSWLPGRRPPSDDKGAMMLEAARAYERLLAVNYFATGDMGAVVLCALTNMTLTERLGRATGELALGFATFGAMCSLVPADGMATSYCRRAVETAKASGDEVAESWVLVNVALVHLQACRWTEMRAALEQVRAMAKRMGFSRRWEEATSQFSTACFLAGHFSEAASLNEELLRSVERADPQTKCWAVVRDAELRLTRDDVAGALAAGREGLALCQQDLGRAEQIFTLGPVMLARLRSGDLAGARTAADQCRDWIAKGDAPVFYNVHAYAALAEVYLALRDAEKDEGRRGELARAARKAVRELAKIARPMAVAAPRALYWRGMFALRLGGDGRRAAKLFSKSLQVAKRQTMPYDEAMALAALGEHADLPAAEKQAHLTEAAATFDRIGAFYESRRIGALSRVAA